MQEELLTFDIEWLSLPKAEFKMLVMIADKGQDLGNASDLCRYFNLSPQSKNKDNLREALENLSEQKIIDLMKIKNNYVAILLNQTSQENKVCLKRKYATEILHHNYTQTVAWEVVLKVYIWLLKVGENIFTNRQIGDCIGVSESTVTEAKNALKEMGAVWLEKVTIKESEQFYKCIGQKVEPSAFWYNVQKAVTFYFKYIRLYFMK